MQHSRTTGTAAVFPLRRTRPALSPIPQLLRLLLLLLTPLWLSLAVEGLGLQGSMPSLLSNWRRSAEVDTTLAPPKGWRERAYLAANPDVAAAVRNGQLSSGYAHYVRQGRAEGRRGGFAEQVGEAAKPAAAQPAPEKPSQVQPAQIQPAQIQPADPQPAAQPAATSTPIPAPPLPLAKPDPQDDAPALRTEPAAEILRPGVKPASAAPRHVERIRTANGGDGLRVVLDLDQDPRFETPVRRPDGRLEVMLPGTLWQAAPSGRLPATALGYRAERSGGGTRLLFSDEDSGTDAKADAVRLLAVSTLAPDKDRGHRLVIDVALPSMAKAERKGR